MRVLISFFTFMVLFSFAGGSEGADYFFNALEGTFVRVPGQSCYNYTFIDDNSARGTMLEQEEIEASLDIPDNVLYDSRLNLCKDKNEVLKAGSNETVSEDGRNKESEPLLTNRSLLPNPEIGFVEEGAVNYSDYEIFRARDTIFYGGVLPFVAIPDSDLANEDRFFNEDSISLFLYFKRKF